MVDRSVMPSLPLPFCLTISGTEYRTENQRSFPPLYKSTGDESKDRLAFFRVPVSEVLNCAERPNWTLREHRDLLRMVSRKQVPESASYLGTHLTTNYKILPSPGYIFAVPCR